MKFIKNTVILLTTIILPCCNFSTVNTSKEVVINSQTWSGTNLSSTHFQNGDKIFFANTDEEWNEAYENKTPAWTWSKENDASGKLYNWYAVTDERGLAPKGWRIPKHDDWLNLIISVDAEIHKTAHLLASEELGGTDQYGFSALPFGRKIKNSEMDKKDDSAYFWNITEDEEDSSKAYATQIIRGGGTLMIVPKNKSDGCSVRLIKDQEVDLFE